jgi:hypothetical protein
MVQFQSVASTTNELLPFVPTHISWQHSQSPLLIDLADNCLRSRNRTLHTLLALFCNSESVFCYCIYETTLTTGCSLCRCWEKAFLSRVSSRFWSEVRRTEDFVILFLDEVFFSNVGRVFFTLGTLFAAELFVVLEADVAVSAMFPLLLEIAIRQCHWWARW